MPLSAKDRNHLKERMDYWQQRLSQQAWHLRLEVTAELRDQGGEPANGYCHSHVWVRTADIELEEDRPSLGAIEDTLVHEILHLAQLPSNRLMERALQHLSPDAAKELWRLYEEEMERMTFVLVNALRPGAQARR